MITRSDVSRARRDLIAQSPMLAPTLSAISLVYSESIPAPMGISPDLTVYVNIPLINHLTWTIQEVRFVLIHEIFHALLHRNIEHKPGDKRWAIALDLHVNSKVISAISRVHGGWWREDHPFLAVPKGAQLPEKYRLANGLSYITYYHLLKNQPDQQEQSQSPESGSGSDQPDQQSNEDQQSQSQQSKQKSTQQSSGNSGGEPDMDAGLLDPMTAAQLQREHGLPAVASGPAPTHESLARALDLIQHTSVQWEQELREYVGKSISYLLGSDDYTYSIPRRKDDGGEIILPETISLPPSIVCVVDTSGSVAMAQVRRAVAELKVLQQSMRTSLSIAYGGSYLEGICEDPADIAPQGGGTNMERVYAEYTTQASQEPDCVVIVTDGDSPWYGTITKPCIVVLYPGCQAWASTLERLGYKAVVMTES